jgi:hypothetical protein
MTQEFLFGLAEFKFATTGTPASIGYIEEGSFDLGGQAGETTEINAAQVKGSPVLVLPKKNGSIKPSFDLIQIKYEKLVLLMGGAVKTTTSGGDTVVTGWEAPSALTQVRGHAQIFTDSGHLIDIPGCTMTAYPNDKLSLDGVAKIHCELTLVQSVPGVAPYSITDAETA